MRKKFTTIREIGRKFYDWNFFNFDFCDFAGFSGVLYYYPKNLSEDE